jgi:Mg2+/Co2+ transporter CorC
LRPCAARWRRAAGAIERLKANPGSAIGAIQVCITMTATLSRVPRVGEVVEVEGVRLRVVESDARVVRRVEVSLVRRAETVGVEAL